MSHSTTKRANLKHLAARLLGTLGCATAALAAFPEPDVVLFGRIQFDGRTMTAADNIQVEARRIPVGAAVARTTLAGLANANNYYSLRLPIDSITPLSRANASVVGDVLYLTVLYNGKVRAQIPYEIRSKGLVQQVDFGEVDTDGDGLPDGWEQVYFFGLNAGANEDPDRDGLTNLQEYQQGTNPNLPDARHPADISPPDNRITIAELSAYYNAWRKGSNWVVGPNPIPQDYVTRASAIWEAGEYYRFDVAFTNAPLWWVNVPRNPTEVQPASSAKAGETNNVAKKVAAAVPAETGAAALRVTSLLPAQFNPGVPLLVTNQVRLVAALRAYTVEETPPAGWVVSGISDGGRFDDINRKIKWGPFFDKQDRDLTYIAVPPGQEFGRRVVGGAGSWDGRTATVAGSRTIVYLPAPAIATGAAAGGLREWVMTGHIGQRYRIECSEDLRTWTTLFEAAVDAASRLSFNDSEGPAKPRRFYRAVLLEAPVGPPAGSGGATNTATQ
jgi:hypothetical protein